MNILVVSLQGIGDLLLTTPMLGGLKAIYPSSKLTVLTFRGHEDILKGNGDVDRVIGFNAKDSGNIIKIAGLAVILRKERFDLAICPYPSGLRTAFIAFLTGAKERLGQELSLFAGHKWLFTRQVPVTEIKHAVLMNMDFLKLLGAAGEGVPAKVRLEVGNDNIRYAEEFLRSNGIGSGDLLIAVHAGGGKFTAAYRNWPLERFAGAADTLAERYGARIVFIGGKDDKTAVDSVMGMMGQKAVSAAGRLSLKQTAAVLTKARFLLCNNSGPMHIAAAVGTRTVSIFGSADPRIHRPWGEGHIVIQDRFDCSPCYYPFFRDTLEETKAKNSWIGKKFVCKTGNYRCLNSITVEQVIKVAEQIIAGKQ